MKQEKVLNSLRESIDHLKTEIVNLEQDIRLLELHSAEKLKVLHFSKVLVGHGMHSVRCRWDLLLLEKLRWWKGVYRT